MRKKNETLHENLLYYAREIADTEGIEAVNIRSIAKKAGIATGTVYNYFADKDEILLALTEEYWRQTLTEMKTRITAISFCEQLEEIYGFLKMRLDLSGGKLMNSLGNVETSGMKRMAAVHTDLEGYLIQQMEQDQNIRKDVWNETFTKEGFARFIMMNVTLLLRTKTPDIYFLLTIVKRTIY